MLKPFSLFLMYLLIVPTAFAMEFGHVDFLIKGNYKAQGQVELKVGKHTLKPDAFGYATVELQPGQHQLEIVEDENRRQVPFQVVANERTQLIVNLFAENQQVEKLEPEVAQIQKKLLSKDRGQVVLNLTSLKGEPVSGAQVFVRGTSINGKSSRSGQVELSLPPGEHTLSVVHKKYATQMVRDLKISKDKKISRKVELTPSGLVLDDFVVLAPNLKGSIEAMIEVRRKASSVADVMSAEQMSKTGDSDAAGSLRRVTGLTLKDGKYVYIRGLGERYSSTLLNGVALPSPDPSRRVIPLDLFPVQFLESMVIQKSYSPDQPGEFGGGVVMLQTKTMPEKFSLKASVSQSQNFNSGDLQGYQGGGSDWLGVDDGFRKAPEGLLDNPQLLVDQGHYELERESSSNSLPDFSFTVGDSWKFRPLRVGYTLSGLFKDQIAFRKEERKRYREDENGELVNDGEGNYIRPRTQKEHTIGGIGGAYFELFKDHKLNFNFIKLRNTTDYVAQLEGENEEGDQIRETQIEWASRTLQTFMVEGENKIKATNDLTIGWHFSESNARRDEPNRTQYTYSPNDEGVYFFNPGDDRAYERRFYDLQEEAQDFGAKLDMPYPWFNSRKAKVTAGFSQMNKDRVSTMQRFGTLGTSCGETDLTQSIAKIFSQCRDNITIEKRTRETDYYEADQELNAYYLKTEIPVLKSLTINSGIRYERSVQNVESIVPFAVTDRTTSQLTTEDWLPGTSVTWKLNQKMQVRLAYSETISRPDLRELSNTIWQDFETGYDVQGNPSLKAAVIESYDARWEWYFAPKENISFGIFTKNFEQPIEQVFTIGSDTRISFLNVPQAVLYGAEVEMSKNLGFMSSRLRRFTIGANYAQLFSNVELGDIQNSESSETSRPLQGQSNYMVNFLLDYEHEPWSLNASLAYNVYGKRIYITGAEGLPTVWELPFNQLDFVLSQNITDSTKFKFKLNNILDPYLERQQGGQTWQRWRKGRSLTLGISMEI